MARGRHYAPRRRLVVSIVKWLGITVGGAAGGLLVVAAAMLASLGLIWAVTAFVSYFL